jgi:hypothetical protein
MGLDVDVLVLLGEKSQNEEAEMETVKTKSVIGADRHLRIDLEVSLPPGPVEVVVVVSPEAGPLPVGIDPEAVRQRFLAAAGCGESRDPLSSHRVDEILYGRKL